MIAGEREDSRRGAGHALPCLAGDHGVFGMGVGWCRECDAVSCGPLRVGAIGVGWRASMVWAGRDGNMNAGVWSYLASGHWDGAEGRMVTGCCVRSAPG